MPFLPWNLHSGQVNGQLQLAQLYLHGAFHPSQQGQPAFPGQPAPETPAPKTPAPFWSWRITLLPPPHSCQVSSRAKNCEHACTPSRLPGGLQNTMISETRTMTSQTWQTHQISMGLAEHCEEEQGLQLGPLGGQHHLLDGRAALRPAALLRGQEAQPRGQACGLCWRGRRASSGGVWAKLPCSLHLDVAPSTLNSMSWPRGQSAHVPLPALNPQRACSQADLLAACAEGHADRDVLPLLSSMHL